MFEHVIHDKQGGKGISSTFSTLFLARRFTVPVREWNGEGLKSDSEGGDTNIEQALLEGIEYHVLISVQALAGCRSLVKLLLNWSEPQSPYVQNSDNINTHFIDFLRGVNEKIYLFQWPFSPFSKSPVSGSYHYLK